MEVDEYNQKLLESFQMGNIMDMHPDFSEYIFFESRKPTGLQHFYDLFFAIRNHRITQFSYYNFTRHNHSQRKVHPIALKESKNRWYLFAVDTKDQKLKSFGLDRIHDLNISNAKYRQKYKFNMRKRFRNTFGIMSLSEEEPQRIIIQCTKHQGEYINSFPLHHSQKLANETEDHIVFEFLLYPTYDFMQEILSYGNEVKVLEPDSLIKDIVTNLELSLVHYNTISKR